MKIYFFIRIIVESDIIPDKKLIITKVNITRKDMTQSVISTDSIMKICCIYFSIRLKIISQVSPLSVLFATHPTFILDQK